MFIGRLLFLSLIHIQINSYDTLLIIICINYSFAGVSRSSSCIIAYLIQEKSMDFSKALYFVRSKRPIVCPNLGFQKQLLEFEKIVKVCISKNKMLLKNI